MKYKFKCVALMTLIIFGKKRGKLISLRTPLMFCLYCAGRGADELHKLDMIIKNNVMWTYYSKISSLSKEDLPN